MTIFSSKVNKELAEAKATILDLQAKLDAKAVAVEPAQNAAILTNKDKEDFDSAIETMKAEFTAKVTTLEAKLTALEVEKAAVVEQSKQEVATAKSEVAAKINEGVAIKIAAKGLTEDELPPRVPESNLTGNKISIIRHKA